MKVQLFTLALTLGAASSAFAKDVSYRVVPQGSSVQWTGDKLVGSGHTGKISVQEGTIVYADGKAKSGKVVVDMGSIVNEDLKDPTWNKKLIDHLRSADFFEVDKHKTSTLVIDKIEQVDATKRRVHGTLTIKGKSKPIKFDAVETDDKGNKSIQANVVFDRTDFDVRYGSGKFFTDLGDKVIADNVKLDVKLSLQP